MLIVGQELQRLAFSKTKPEDCDVFGRSAFNRYYYASYLIVREMLTKFDKKWARQSHGGIPDLLRGDVLKQIRHQTRLNLKAKLINESKAHSIRSTANQAASDLAQLLILSYDLRTKADYEPDLKVTKLGGKIYLTGRSLNSAESWPSEAEMLTKKLLKIWRQELGM